MKTLCTFMTGVAVSTSAFAADAPAPAPIVDALTLKESASIYAKDGTASTVAALNSTLAAKALGLDWHFTVPVYVSDASGYGSMELGVSWDFLKDISFLSSKTKVNVEGGLWMPTGSAGYETTNLNPHIGFGVNLDWTDWNFNQTADYRFVPGTMYDPLIGSRIGEDVVSLVSDLNYKLGNNLNVGLNITQEYFDGGGVVLLGPSMEWNAASSVDVHAGIGFPVWQDLVVENNCVVNAGVSFKF